MEKIIYKAEEGGFERYILVSPLEEEFKEYILNPLFWQALGKACGWIYTRSTTSSPVDMNNQRNFTQEGWKFYAMRFHEINLIEGWNQAVEYLEGIIN